ncbi:endoribonuclease ZC3H12A isoform X2 [Nilaparvata lugens]|uniref:endoribonuclease ZC3H12A isoform X2 n=1 Tax=Nilaparvata lugens TaxID=108931 RepID=UPI00193D0FDF|nr:endoribonuclease ZC3H12A isoform X2 [Nilaparvata lugens]
MGLDTVITQNYVDQVYSSGGSGKMAVGGGAETEVEGEDSSYDSDADLDSGGGRHDDVSRTTSDTLAAEYADYVSSAALPQAQPHPAANYTAKVEFALKLGYTERQVQAALQKLGPNPGQNELLAELIKLGAQTLGPRLGGSESDLGCSLMNAADDSLSDSLASMQSEHPSITAISGEPHAEQLRLRPVVIDGSNVAKSHGNKEVFSCRGIKLCVDWFRSRGHKEITVFVPKWRKESSRPDNPITDQEILNELERDRLLVFTPSRLLGGKRTVCYDDRYILRLAAENDGIVVSNDNYRDLAQESPEFRKVVEERILMYSFVNDRFMPPDDPLGRSGPTLDNFLRFQPHPPPPCPYGKKCTYGNKCKFHHPERGPLPHKSVTERLVEHAQRQLQARGRDQSPANQIKGKSLSLPLSGAGPGANTGPVGAAQDCAEVRKTPLSRTKSNVVVGEGGGGLDTYRSPPPGYPMYATTAGGAAPWMHAAQPQSAARGDGLHRKLQRQLTLNPVCDPRLYQMQRYMSQHEQPHVAAPPPHPNVTRIASAPPAHPSHGPHPAAHAPWHEAPVLSSASDPQLNLSAPPPPLAWSVPPPQLPPHHPPPPPPAAPEEARRRLHYHLASLFPEEQVHTVLQLYPNETNPQKICAAILAMFPTTNQPLG